MLLWVDPLDLPGFNIPDIYLFDLSGILLCDIQINFSVLFSAVTEKYPFDLRVEFEDGFDLLTFVTMLFKDRVGIVSVYLFGDEGAFGKVVVVQKFMDRFVELLGGTGDEKERFVRAFF